MNTEITKYVDMDCLLTDMRKIEEDLSAADAMVAMSRVYLANNGIANDLMTLDPFSIEYSKVAMRLYNKISGISCYDPCVNELTPYVDPAQSVRSPAPYQYQNSKVVGDFLSSWGWIFQALDVKAGDAVLEYGAGEGQLSIMLSRMGVNVTVIDIDERYLESIRAQADSLGVSITLKQGGFGDGYKENKFDRILFFEAIHHAFDHREVVDKLKSHLTNDGYVVFSGEPIVCKSQKEALFVPFPWGPRLDGASIRSTNRFGWCELGFQEEYFIEMLMRAGFLVTYLPCPVTGRGNCFIAKPSNGKIFLGRPYSLSIFDRDCGWHEPEGSHRWTKELTYLTLPDNYAEEGGYVTLSFFNFLSVDREVAIAPTLDNKAIRVLPGTECTTTVLLQPTRYLEIHTAPIIPKDTIQNSTDDRSLGIAVVWIKLAHTLN